MNQPESWHRNLAKGSWIYVHIYCSAEYTFINIQLNIYYVFAIFGKICSYWIYAISRLERKIHIQPIFRNCSCWQLLTTTPQCNFDTLEVDIISSIIFFTYLYRIFECQICLQTGVRYLLVSAAYHDDIAFLTHWN